MRNGFVYYKDGGSFEIANGALIVLSTSGTGLQIASNGSIAESLTVGSLIDNGDMSALGNNITFPSPNNIMNVANSIYTTNLWATNLHISGNAYIEGSSLINADAIILNANGGSAIDAWLEVYRAANNNPAYVLWSESNKAWMATSNVAGNVLSPILTTANLMALPADLSTWGELLTTVGAVNTPNTVTCNLANTNVFDITLANTLSHDVHITFTHAASAGISQPVTLILRQSGPANTVSFANSIIWSGNAVPVLSTGGSGFVDVLTFVTVDGGAHFIGGAAGGVNPLTLGAAANTVEVISNFGNTYPQKVLNFANSASVNVAVTSNGANVDLFFSCIANVTSNVTVATAAQANFTLPSTVANNNPNLVIVTRNGLVQNPTEYSVSGTILTLNTPALINEVVTSRVLTNIGGAAEGGGGSSGLVSNSNTLIYITGTDAIGTTDPLQANSAVFIQANNQVVAVDFSATSDATLKNVIATFHNALDDIDMLTPVRFTWNDKAKALGFNDPAVQVGLLAQDVQAVLPEAVSINQVTGALMVSYDRVVPLLLAALKELKAKVSYLESR